jgi:hypothetical protein
LARQQRHFLATVNAMEPDETPTSQPQSTKAEHTPAPTDAELSRIAREAVRQPADPRLDKQLARMGLSDAPAPTAPAASGPAAIDPTVEGLQRRLRRLESVVWVLVAAVGILAVAVIVLLLR